MKKVIKSIAGALAIVGFVLILGTAGLSDNNLIGIGEVVTRIFWGGGMMIVGIFTAGIIDEKENA